MKIEQSKLTGFLKKAKLSGTESISECVWNFDKDGLKLAATTASKQTRVVAWLKSTAFKDYEAVGEVGINDMSTIVKVFDRFSGLLTLKREGNLLSIKGEGKSVDVELISVDLLETDTKEPKLEFEETFVIEAKKLKDIYGDVKMNKDAILIVETGEKNVAFMNTGKYKFKNVLEAPMCSGKTKVSFGEALIDATEALTDSLEISVKTDYPAKVREKTEDSVVTIIVAPRVAEE